MNTDLARCVILGGGGHARVLIDCLQSSGVAIPYAVLDADVRRGGQELLGVPILGGDDMLTELVAAQRVNCFVVGLGAVSDSRPRQRLFEYGRSFGLQALTVVHPSAHCSPWASIGAGSQLLPGCIVNACVEIGQNVIVNSGAIVEHDCIIADHAHVATGAKLAGRVRVGVGSHIGLGACVREGVAIGQRAVVGAGAVVIADVPDGMVVVGVPARRLRMVSDV